MAILIKDNILFEMLTDCNCITEDYEVLSLIVNNIILSVFYRPPGGNLDSFFTFFEAFLDFAGSGNYKVIWGGDSNIDIMSGTPSYRQMNTFINAHSCLNVVSLPTRITNQSATVLDLFITNFGKEKIRSAAVSAGISDHLGIFLSISESTNEKRRPTIFFQNITQDTLSNFRTKLSQTEWSEVLEETDADEAYIKFLSIFCPLYRESFPYIQKKQSKKYENLG